MAVNFVTEANMHEWRGPHTKQSSKRNLVYGMLSEKESIINNQWLSKNHKSTTDKELDCIVLNTPLVELWVLLLRPIWWDKVVKEKDKKNITVLKAVSARTSKMEFAPQRPNISPHRCWSWLMQNYLQICLHKVTKDCCQEVIPESLSRHNSIRKENVQHMLWSIC